MSDKEILINKIRSKSKTLNDKIQRISKKGSSFEGVNVKEQATTEMAQRVTNRFSVEGKRELMTDAGRLTRNKKILNTMSYDMLEEYLSDIEQFSEKSKFSSQKAFNASEDAYAKKATDWVNHIRDKFEDDEQWQKVAKDPISSFGHFVDLLEEAKMKLGKRVINSDEYIRQMYFELHLNEEELEEYQMATRIYVDRENRYKPSHGGRGNG